MNGRWERKHRSRCDPHWATASASIVGFCSGIEGPTLRSGIRLVWNDAGFRFVLHHLPDMITWLPPGTIADLRRQVHALREPLGSLVIRLALLDDEIHTDAGQQHIDSMLASVQRMVAALAEITATLCLELGDSTPLAILSKHPELRRGMVKVEPPEVEPRRGRDVSRPASSSGS